MTDKLTSDPTLTPGAFRLELDRFGKWWVHYHRNGMHRHEGPHPRKWTAVISLAWKKMRYLNRVTSLYP